MRQPSVLDVYDPLEPLNRAIYNFNAGFDRYVFLPIVRAYEFLTPDFVEDRVSDFFDNIGEIPTFANALLQLKPETAGRSATRFIVNTMFTAGLFDLAGARGVARASEDFGQTLGHWGLGRGPYLVIPVLGPSNLRDGAGIARRLAAVVVGHARRESPAPCAYNAVRFGLQPVDARHRIAFRYYDTGSPFEYDLVRLHLHRDARARASRTERRRSWQAAPRSAPQSRLKDGRPKLARSGNRRIAP